MNELEAYNTLVERLRIAEERADQLAKANEALRRSVSTLAKVPNVRAALVEAVRTAADLLGAPEGVLGVFLPEENRFRDLFHIREGMLIERDGMDFLAREFPLDEEPVRLAWEQFQSSKSVLWCPPDSPYLVKETRERLLSFGLPSFVLVSVKRGEDCIGYLGFSTHLKQDLSTPECDLLKAIADQISLMLEIARLAKTSETLVVTRERAAAAEQRMGELIWVSETIRRTGTRLSAAADSSQILPLILSEACQTIGGMSGVLSRYLPGSRSLVVEYAFDGDVVRPAIPEHPYGDAARPMPVSLYPSWEVLIQTDQPLYTTRFDVAHGFHKMRGHVGLLRRALTVDGRPFGMIALSLREEREFSRVELELFNTLAQQATLAFQIADLATVASEQASETAVLKERTRVAQDLHDTLMQTIQACKMLADECCEAETNPDQMKTGLIHLANWLAKRRKKGAQRWNRCETSGGTKATSPQLSRIS